MLQSHPKIPMAAAGQLCSGGACVFWKLGSYYHGGQPPPAGSGGKSIRGGGQCSGARTQGQAKEV